MDRTFLPDNLRGALAVAVDDSPAAREALRWTAALAGRLVSPWHVVTVWNFVHGDAPAGEGPTASPSLARWQAESERRLAALVDEEAPDAGAQLLCLHGNTVPTLLALSDLVDHLVVGTRGRGGFSGLLLGSTSDQLVRYAHCPVTVVGHRRAPG
ncbi:MAG: universal stress protein [Frankiales bacterium]|nr:universal stress protein [Frankiales bacterium]